MTVEKAASPPCVLVIAGHDPSGGAGIAADIEAVRAFNAHPLTVITALTEQDSATAYRYQPADPDRAAAHIRRLSADFAIGAVKTGMLGTCAMVEVAAAAVRGLRRAQGREVPLVVDPVLAADDGSTLSRRGLAGAIRRELLPLASVVTPNSVECMQLSGVDGEADNAARRLLELGADHVLLTGGHGDGPDVVNTLFSGGDAVRTRWPRLPHRYHGSGCTLASAIAALLADGENMPAAVTKAQEYTWEALRDAYSIGHGQHMPKR